ncbi:MAG TPA: hypothetical protein PK453_28675, partial [Leptospiraceae bacterium]|nr:hypothetical protein [Leptospiraceae bacterium]
IKSSSIPFVGASIGYRFELDSGFLSGFELGTGRSVPVQMKPEYTFQVEPNVGLLNTSRAQNPFLNYAYREYLMEKNLPFKTAEADAHCSKPTGAGINKNVFQRS